MDQQTINSLNSVAQKLNVPALWLSTLINKESSWNPQIKNPRSSARGLIQFMDATARDMGFEGSEHLITAYPTVSEQLETPVYDYLKQYAPFDTNAELYLAVFYPAYRKNNYNQRFTDRVIQSNPGLLTPAHYVAFVEGKLNALQQNNITISSLIKNNPGYTPIQDVVLDTPNIVQSLVQLSPEKKKTLATGVICMLTLSALLYHIYKK